MSETGREPPAAPESAQYGLGRMIEDTVTAPLRANAVFSALAGQPAPPYGIMIPNALVFCAASYAAYFVRAALVSPEILQASPAVTAVAALAAMLLAVPLSFLAAGVLHAFMLLAGGGGDFQRSYQASSLLSLLLALQSLLNWFDWVWALPALLAAYLAAVAAARLHRAPMGRAAAVFALLGACAIAGQGWLRPKVSRLAETAKAVGTAAAAAQDLGRQLQEAQQASAPPQQGTSGGTASLPQDRLLPVWTAESSTPSLPNVISGLQLLLAPTTGAAQAGSPALGPQLQAQAEAQTQTLQLAAANMLAPLMAMLNNPALTQGMSPEQAKQMRAMNEVLARLQASAASGKKSTPEEQAAMMAQFQSTMFQFAAQMSAGPRGAGGMGRSPGSAAKKSKAPPSAPKASKPAPEAPPATQQISRPAAEAEPAPAEAPR